MSQNQIKDIFKDTFRAFEKKGEENVDTFVLNELTSIYDDEDKAKEVADEINSFFDRIDENMKEIQEGKEKSISTARWFQNKLDDYQVIAKDLPQELLGRLNEVTNESIGDLINEPFIREVNLTDYEGIGKKIISSKIIDLVKEDANIGIINNEIIFNSLGEIVDTEIKSIKKYFDVEMDSPFDKSIKKLGTVAALKVQKTGNFKPFNDKSPTELAAIVDNTLTVAKVGYKIATGEIRASDATDYLIDRGTARLEAVVNQTCVKYGAMAGAKIGGVVGSVFGPAGTVVGTAIGKAVGAMAGQYVSTKIGEGIKKIATKAKEVVGNISNKIGTMISNGVSGIKSVSPQSNNAYKTSGTSGTINVSNKGGACLMPSNKLTIVPVKLDPLPIETSSNYSATNHASPSCVMKTTTVEISFFNGVEERIIQTILKELNS